MQLFKMHETNPKGMFPIEYSEAKKENESGHGIFWSVNSFNGARRIENLVRINAWAVDIDSGTKEEMLVKIKTGLTPTKVVETKRGFHCYFKAMDAQAKHWNSIVLDRLVPFYGADKNARDLARVLRVPGFYHMKDPANPFLIRSVFESRAQYTETDMAYFYPDKQKEKRDAFKKEMKEFDKSGNIWEEIWRMDCMDALTRLSGHEAIGCETISFKRNSKGTHQILVNGKSTSCWIDEEMRIGSYQNGGPTVLQFVDWYHKNKTKSVGYLKSAFPELSWNK